MNQQRATLKDIINYAPETHISPEEVALIQSHFKDNPRLLSILRKVFLPSVGDPSLPVEEIGQDLWLNMDFAPMQNDEIKPIVLARQDAIKFVAGGLIKLKIIANGSVESEAELKARRAKDSAK